MITETFAREFATEWIAAWNSHNLERILSHYSDDIVFESPYAIIVVPESEGTVSGKDALRSYWQKGLTNNPNLLFEHVETLIGVNGLTIYYNSVSKNKMVAEVLFFNNHGKVNRSYACYN